MKNNNLYFLTHKSTSGSSPQIPAVLINDMITSYKNDYENYKKENNVNDLSIFSNNKLGEIIEDRFFYLAWLNLILMVSEDYDKKFIRQFIPENCKPILEVF